MTLQHPAGPPPSITEAAVSGNAVLAATDQNPLFDQHLGSLDDFETNIRGWGEACGADTGAVESLLARMRRTNR